MALATATGTLLIDLLDTGSFSIGATDISAYWIMEQGFSITGRGRQKENDAAGMSSMTIRLDNKNGRFSPKNASGAYYPNFTTYKRVQATITFSTTTTNIFTGTITDIKVDPSNREGETVITLRDDMFILSRTDIRRPLMREQYTGLIIDRILDDVEGAEDREWVANQNFDQNDNGYTTFGTSTKTRVTTGEFLESVAAEVVTTSAVNSGVRYTIPRDVNGLSGTFVAYVKPEGDSEIGKNVRLQIQDDLGLITTFAVTPMADRDRWTVLRGTATYNSGSTAQYIQVIASASGTSFRIGAVHAAPSVNAIARTATDGGQSRLPQYQYFRGPALQAIQEVRENEPGGLFYFDGSGVAHFEDRTHRWENDHVTTTVTLTDRGVFDYQEDADDRVKAVILDYPHYVEGSPGTVVWQLNRVVSLPIGEAVTIEADYQGANVKDTIIPVANTDYTITGAADGTGGDYSGLVSFSFNDYGGGSSATFTNASTKMVYLRTYQVRGTVTRLAEDRSPARYTPSGGPKLAATLTHNYKYAEANAVAAFAQYLGDRYSTQREKLGLQLSCGFPRADITSSDMVSILARQISDRVTIVNTLMPFATDVNGDYYIDSIALSCPGESLQCKWQLSPVDADYWVLEEAGTSLGTNTVLAA